MEIKGIFPKFGMEGGLVSIECAGFDLNDTTKDFPQIHFGPAPAHLVSVSATRIMAQIPPGAGEGAVLLSVGSETSRPFPLPLATRWAAELHPVANPAVAGDGSVYTTVSGGRGQRVDCPLYRIEPDGTRRPQSVDIMNPTGLAFDRQGMLYISSRYNGAVYRVDSDGELDRFVGDLGVATGLAFDEDDNLYVGDRNGVIYRVTPQREISEFAKLEPSVSAYHLAFGPDGYLYVSGPTISTRDSIYKIDASGDVSIFFSGLGRPQGLLFDSRGTLYVGASYKGKKGIFRITKNGSITHFLSAPIPVGLAFDRDGRLIIATNEALYRLSVALKGALLH